MPDKKHHQFNTANKKAFMPQLQEDKLRVAGRKSGTGV
jgi:hypothetical protein